LHVLRLRSLPATDNTNVLHCLVRRRYILRNGGLSVHELPCWQVFDNRRDLHLLIMRVRSVPASHWADIVQLAVPTGSVLGHHRQCLHQLRCRTVFNDCWNLLVCDLCRRAVPDIDCANVVCSVRMRHLQQQHRTHHGMHYVLHRRLLLQQRRERLLRVPRRDVRIDNGSLLLRRVRLRHVQHEHREDDGVHQQVRHRAVLEHWSSCLLVVPRRHVHSAYRNLHLHKLRGREVPDFDRADDVHELCMRHLQYHDWPHHSLHHDLRHRALLEHRCVCLHAMCRR
jgi:hypothetical protein